MKEYVEVLSFNSGLRTLLIAALQIFSQCAFNFSATHQKWLILNADIKPLAFYSICSGYFAKWCRYIKAACRLITIEGSTGLGDCRFCFLYEHICRIRKFNWKITFRHNQIRFQSQRRKWKIVRWEVRHRLAAKHFLPGKANGGWLLHFIGSGLGWDWWSTPLIATKDDTFTSENIREGRIGVMISSAGGGAEGGGG